MKFCVENLGKRKLNARLIPHSLTEKQKEHSSSICAILSKLQARITNSALPSSLEMKHDAYSTTHEQKDTAHSGETQTHLPQRNLVSSLRKQKQCWLVLSTAKMQGIRNCSSGSNCKPRCQQRCTAKFMRQHLTSSPRVVSKREVVPPTWQCTAVNGIIHHFFSINQITVLPHASNSPDGTLRFFPLFPWLKCTLKGYGYADIEDIQMIMTKKLRSVPESAFQYCFKDLQQYCKCCTETGGSYFEEDP